MPTDLPYAAEAEITLSFDELEVSFRFLSLRSSGIERRK